MTISPLKMAFIAVALCATTVTASAQSITTIATFDGTDGSGPLAGLVQGFDGNLWGTTTAGGAHSGGVIYNVSTDGEITTVYSFCSLANCADGEGPSAALLLTVDGNFYGTAAGGGAHKGGTVFEATPLGRLKTLYSFCSENNCADGKEPYGIVRGGNGSFYGVTAFGGAGRYCLAVAGCGTFFEITPAGKLTTLYNFCSQPDCTDGEIPGSVIQAANGNFYGTTRAGGRTGCYLSQTGCGTLFEFTAAGKFNTLYSFCAEGRTCTDGAEPYGTLMQASNGTLYGTTFEGGNWILPNGFSAGTAFEITTSGTFTPLYDFCPNQSCSNGADPQAGLLQGTDGNFYGTTYEPGSIFSLTPQGSVTSYLAGDYVSAPVVQATNGNFYGSTILSNGSVISLSTGLAPFAETLPTSGKAGASVVILGTDLTGATSVTFNGTAATYNVVSATEITAEVPAGATTGTVEVVTPGGTLDSNVVFRVVN